MRSNILLRLLIGVMAVSFSISCEKDFDIGLKPNRPMLIVEAYINNTMPLYTYVMLGKSQDYFNPNLENIPVSGATVSITAGNMYEWWPETKREMKEMRLPALDSAALRGVYFDPVLAIDPARALVGSPGTCYLLEIETEGKRYSAITKMQEPLPLDSLTTGDHFSEEDDGIVYRKARLTAYWKDPDTIGNTQLYYWMVGNYAHRFGWGGMGTGRYVIGNDDLVNGQYIRLTHNNGFAVGDTVTYHLINVERKVYNFWDSFNKARINGGPFTTPATIQSTVTGEDVLGCFSGFSISSKSILVQ